MTQRPHSSQQRRGRGPASRRRGARSASPASRSASSRCTSLDDTFLQPQPGHVGRRPPRRAASSRSSLLVAAAVALPAAPRRRARARSRSLAGFLGAPRRHARPATTRGGRPVGRRLHRPARRSPRACCCVGLGAVTLWRSRRLDDGRVVALPAPGAHRRRRVSSSRSVILFPFALGYVHHARRPRRYVPTADLGAPYEDVSFTTSDGLRLQGWYIRVAERRRGDLVPRPRGLAEARARCSPTTATACCSSTAAARARARATRNLFGWQRRAGHPRRGRVPAAPARRRPASGSAASASRSAAR